MLQNNSDEIHVAHRPNQNNDHEVCDDRWHSIEIVKDVNTARFHIGQYEVNEESLIDEFDSYTDRGMFIERISHPLPIINALPTCIACLTTRWILFLCFLIALAFGFRSESGKCLQYSTNGA